MNLEAIEAGSRIPEEINVIIEIPAMSEPVKYEVCKKTGAICVDRFLTTHMFYNCNYGYIPHTLGLDQDPVDVLLVAPCRLIPGTVVRARPVGLLKMEDEAGQDSKILALPIPKLTSAYDAVKEYQDLPACLLGSIRHFFEHYKDLEPKKWVKVSGWAGVGEAQQEIIQAVKRYQQEISI